MRGRKKVPKQNRIVVPERSYHTEREEREYRILKERFGIRDALAVAGCTEHKPEQDPFKQAR